MQIDCTINQLSLLQIDLRYITTVLNTNRPRVMTQLPLPIILQFPEIEIALITIRHLQGLQGKMLACLDKLKHLCIKCYTPLELSFSN